MPSSLDAPADEEGLGRASSRCNPLLFQALFGPGDARELMFSNEVMTVQRERVLCVE